MAVLQRQLSLPSGLLSVSALDVSVTTIPRTPPVKMEITLTQFLKNCLPDGMKDVNVSLGSQAGLNLKYKTEVKWNENVFNSMAIEKDKLRHSVNKKESKNEPNDAITDIRKLYCEDNVVTIDIESCKMENKDEICDGYPDSNIGKNIKGTNVVPENFPTMSNSKAKDKLSISAGKGKHDINYNFNLENHKHRKKKVQGKNKKWKSLDVVDLGFEFSLLPRIVPNVPQEAAEIEMRSELIRFEIECSKSEDGGNICNESTLEKVKIDSEMNTQSSADELSNNCKVYSFVVGGDLTAREVQDEEREIKRMGKEMLNPRKWIQPVEWQTCMENKVDYNTIEAVSIHQGNTPCCLRLRSKKKYKISKVHNQVKSKHCLSFHNGGHKKNVYIKHRVIALMKINLDVYRNPNKLSVKRIDKIKGFKGRPSQFAASFYQMNNINTNNTQYPVAQATVGHIIDSYNFDGALSAELVNIMQTVQYRDISPEDFDLLLRLDERVLPKTVDNNILQTLKVDTATSDVVDDVCMVCLDQYEEGQQRKFLPCGHVFHAHCIDMWLTNSSHCCPVDSTEVMGES